MFKPHKQAKARRRSAVALIKYVLAMKKPDVLPSHCEELLDVLLWKITEADGKYNTPFKSEGALHRKTKLRHDHVYQRLKMIARLVKAAPQEIDKILRRAIACTVMIKEHHRLSKFDKKYDGWERYQRAGIQVMDTRTNKRIKMSGYRNLRKRE